MRSVGDTWSLMYLKLILRKFDDYIIIYIQAETATPF